MPFIIEAIVGLVGFLGSAGAGISAFAAGLGGFGSTLLNLGLAAGLTLLQKALTPKKKSTTQGGVQASVTFGGDISRETVFGLMATAGQWVYWNTYGTNNRYLQLVFDLSDGACDSLSAMWANGKPCTFGTPEARGTPVNEFPGKMWVRFYNGEIDQAADDGLVDNSNPAGRWTEDSRGAGQCYIVVEIDTDATLFEGGIPQFLFLVKGYKCYDPRKDSTQTGGSGAHRWGTPGTYEWSDNPAVCEYNYRRGVWLGTELVVGMGLPGYDLRTDLYMAAANICDEDVDLDAGGTEKRYRCGLIANDQDPHETWIAKFLDAMAGVEIDSAGEFGPIAGAAQTEVAEITDGDLLADRPRSTAHKAQRGDRVNAVFGKFSDPAQQWREQPFPPRTSTDDEAADGNERFAPPSLDLVQVYSGTQAQRISEIVRRKGRLTATEDIWLPFEFWRLEPGDWITRTSDQPGYPKTMVVLQTRTDKEKKVNLQLREINEEVYDWNEAVDELPGSTAVDLPGEGVRASTVTGLTVTAFEIEGTGGQIRPALRVTWTPITDPTVDVVRLEYRIEGTTDVIETPQANPGAGEAVIINGIQASTDYEVRATIDTTPKRITTWTTWVPETSTENYVVKSALASEIGTGSLGPELSRLIKVDFPAIMSKIQDDILRISQIVADQDASQLYDRETTVRSLESHFGNALAKIVEVQEVLTSANEALAQQLTDIEAEIGDNIATVVNSLSAQVTDLNGRVTSNASAISAVQAIANGVSASGLIKLTAVADSTLGAVAAFDVEVAAASAPGIFRKAGTRWIIWQQAGVFFSRIVDYADERWIGTDGAIKEKVDPITGAGSIEILGP